MNQLPFFAIIGPVVSTTLFALVKAGFLIWVYIRTQKNSAIAYGLFILLASAGGLVAPALLVSIFSVNDTATLQTSLFAYGFLSSLIEVCLFIWFVRSLLKSPRSSLSDSSLADSSTAEPSTYE